LPQPAQQARNKANPTIECSNIIWVVNELWVGILGRYAVFHASLSPSLRHLAGPAPLYGLPVYCPQSRIPALGLWGKAQNRVSYVWFANGMFSKSPLTKSGDENNKNGRDLQQIPAQIRAVYYFHHLQVAPTGGANKRWPVFAANPRQGWAIFSSRRQPEQRGLAGRSFTRTIQKHGTREIAKRRGHGLIPPERKYHCNLGLV